MYLDSMTPLAAEVGYGSLGVGGDLGYEGARVRVGQRTYEHALSTHPPARIAFDLGGSYATFRCDVALNDDVPHGRSHADFFVRADGRTVAAAHYVLAGTGPREIVADVSGAQCLELCVQTSRWEHSHAVWLEPRLDTTPLPAQRSLVDSLGRAEIELVAVPPAERCIGTVVSPGFDGMLDDMLGSLLANGNCPEARLVVFAVNPDERCAAVASKYGATLVPCRPLRRLTAAIKSVLYSLARVADARQFLCLDADILVTGDLGPVFSALDALPERSVLAVRDGNGTYWRDLEHGFRENYCGTDAEMTMLRLTEADLRYRFVVNDGLLAASRYALLSLDSMIRSTPNAARWLDSAPHVGWRNQFILNLALARLDAGVELDPAWNVQLHGNEVSWDPSSPRLRAWWNGRPAHTVHFSGWSKSKYPEVQGRYASVAQPLVAPTPGDGYGRFLAALRPWIGDRGTEALAWSFYGTTDGKSATVRDASTFPLFALLHYLIRANGCVRVLETGTARGISAACLASAVAHRDGGRVVTFDPFQHEGRENLWSSLPPEIRACIEPRAVDSIEGMAAALLAGERYEAALLDSLHTEERVWAEFDVARQLVCPGGLILVHDPLYANGTVDRALRRIEAEGYGIVRLWTADGGAQEDDHLGLAVIENRGRPNGGRS
jgi:predicted O-methyltransferase YrrM